MKQIKELWKKDKKSFVLMTIAFFVLLVIVVGATFAYFTAQTGTGKSTSIKADTATTDSLRFETEGEISIHATQQNFGQGDNNLSSTAKAKAILRANNNTNSATEHYNLYFDIIENSFSYTTSAFVGTPELLLKITDPNGNEVTKIYNNEETDSKIYKTVVDGKGNEVSGFDLLYFGMYDYSYIPLIEGYEITTTSEITQEWQVEVILVNLAIDQNKNTGKNFEAKLVIKKEEPNTLKRADLARISNIWQHNDKITKIEFENEMKDHSAAEYTYDISAAQDESVMAYVINNGDNTYTTYIDAIGKIIANTNSSSLFEYFRNLQTIEGLEYLDTSQVTDMTGMFYDCRSLTTLDVTTWNTSQVIDMSLMFYNCNKLTTIDVSNFDTSQVTNMKKMFEECNSLTAIDVSNFDTSQVTNMSSMFINCNNLTTLDVSNFNTSQVTKMFSLFEECNSLTAIDVSKWNTSQVTDMGGMFYNCNKLTTIDVSNFDTSQVTDMSFMFSHCSSLTTLDLSNFDTSQVTNMWGLFDRCSGLTNLNIRNFDISNVINYENMLQYIKSGITITVKDNTVKSFIESRLSEASVTGNVVIV